MGISQGFVSLKLSFTKKKVEEGGKETQASSKKFLRHVTVLMRLLSR